MKSCHIIIARLARVKYYVSNNRVTYSFFALSKYFIIVPASDTSKGSGPEF